MLSKHEIEKNELVHFSGEISRETIDSLLLKIEDTFENVKWMKSVLRVSYDLLMIGHERGDSVEYILGHSNGTHLVYCKHNKVPNNTAEFIVNAINKLKDYDDDKLRELIKRLTEKHSPITKKGTFFEDIIWGIYNIYRRKYANIEVDYIPLDVEFVEMEFIVTFKFSD